MVVINDVLSKTVKLCHNRWSRTRENVIMFHLQKAC